MKHARSAVRDHSDAESGEDPFMDEAMAMVYVGDVYSLVAQNAMPGNPKEAPAHDATPEQDKPQDDNDALWPLIR